MSIYSGSILNAYILVFTRQKDTDVVGVKLLCSSLPGINEGSFDKE